MEKDVIFVADNCAFITHFIRKQNSLSENDKREEIMMLLDV